MTPRRALRSTAFGLALWIPMVVLFWVALAIQTQGYLSVAGALVSAVRLALMPGVCGVAIWWVTGQLQWPERRPFFFLAVHALLGSAFAVAMGWWTVIPLLHGVSRDVDSAIVLRSILPWQIASGYFLYGLMAGVSYAVRGSWWARDLRLATERAERLRAQAELAVLRAHINPHFLFNTLHSVTQLLRTEPERAEAALERLSDLFRYALQLDRAQVELVSLEEEWRFTQSYLWLEQMRLGERFRVDAALSDDALACAVPPFTLQPLVENAVRHGLSPKREGGTLTVRASESGGALLISVSDDGVGADPSALSNGTGIGVRAVRQRIEARHGAAARTDISGAPGTGLTITLTLPAETTA